MAKAAQRRLDITSTVAGILFGLTCATYLETTNAHDWQTVYGVITSISRICALTGAYLALVGLVLVARIPYIERSVGHDRLVIWHRKLGPWSMYLISFHVLLVILGYAGNDRVKLGVELWRMVKNYPWMLPALIGFIFFVTAGITSYKRVRKNMTYETWWTVHLYTYLAISLGYMHQVLTGPMFIGHPLNRMFWELLYIYTAVLLLLWRFIIPVVKSLRHQLRVEQIVKEAPGIYSVVMRGRALDKLGAQGGQFFGWRFLTRGQWWISHPYSLSASPTNHFMRVTIKELGDHSSLIKKIKKGTRVFFEGPYGTFTASRASRGHITLIGGGVGITPIRALMEEIDITKEIDVIFRASKDEDILFKRELDELARVRGARIHYLIGSRKDHPMKPKDIEKYIPSFKDSDVYVCGPTALVDTVRESAQKVGIPKNRFHDEAFEFHNVVREGK